MNILVVQETNWLEKFPFEPHHMFEILSMRGHKITVIDYEDHWKRREASDYGKLQTAVYEKVEKLYSGASVTVRRPGMIKIPGLSRLSASLTHTFEILRTLTEDVDVVVLYSVPTNGLQALVAGKILDARIVFHSLDVLHEVVRPRILRLPTLVLENMIYRYVDRIIAITPGLAEYVQMQGAKANKVVMIPAGVDVERFNPKVDGNDVRERFGIADDEKVVLFTGWLYDFSGLDLIVEAMPKIIEEVQKMRLVIVGEGPLSSKLQSLVKKLDLGSRVLLLGRQPYSLIPKFMAASDVCINPFKPNEVSKNAFPVKVLEYMASGKSTVASRLPGTEAILGEDSGTVLVENEEFVDKLIEILKDEQLIKELGEKSRKTVEEKFSYDKITDRFERILLEVAKHDVYIK